MPNREYIPIEKRREIKARAYGRCEYCKCFQKYSPGAFVIEHIIPLILGGTYLLDNLAYTCWGCNHHKYTAITALDPITNLVVPLFNPRLDSWANHFSWSDDFLEMIGKTPTGRATIIRLKTNRLELMNIRRLTLLTKEHPPIE